MQTHFSAVRGDALGTLAMPTRGAESASTSSSDSRDGRERGRRRRRHDSSDDDSSSSSDSSRGRSRRRRRDTSRDESDRSRDRRLAKKARKQEKKAKKARKREKKEAKREAKRARRRARDDDDRDGATAERARPGGLELRSRETADALGRCEREEETREATRPREDDKPEMPLAAPAEATTKRPEAEHEARSDVPVAAPASGPDAFGGFGAAMTLEQYRAMVSQRAYMRGTVHAALSHDKPPEPETRNAQQWACASYRCGKGGAAVMNAKFADRCSACGAMKPLNAGAETFTRTMTDAQYLANQSRRRGK